MSTLSWTNMLKYVQLHELSFVLNDSRKVAFLQIAVIDTGEPFVKATYNLEGDGSLVLKCRYKPWGWELKVLITQMWMLKINVSKIGHTCQQWKQYTTNCLEPGLNYYFRSKFCGDSAELKESLDAFKARLFVPHGLVEMNADINAVVLFIFAIIPPF